MKDVELSNFSKYTFSSKVTDTAVSCEIKDFYSGSSILSLTVDVRNQTYPGMPGYTGISPDSSLQFHRLRARTRKGPGELFVTYSNILAESNKNAALMVAPFLSGIKNSTKVPDNTTNQATD